MRVSRRPTRRVALGLAVLFLLGACGRGTPEQNVASQGTEQAEAPVPAEAPLPPEAMSSTTAVDASTTSTSEPTTTTTAAPKPTTTTMAKARAGDRCDDPTATDFPLTTNGGQPAELAPAPDGAVWFTDNGTTPAIGRLAPDGTVRMFPLSAGRDPASIAIGPDGNVWFTQYAFTKITAPGSPDEPAGPPPPPGPPAIGRISPDGTMTEFPLPTTGNSAMAPYGMASEVSPRGITVGPDGALWFAESSANQIGRITTDGVITEYPLSTAGSENSWPTGPILGSDGALWFYETYPGKLGRIDPVTKAITERPVDLGPSTSAMDRPQFWDLETGPDGGMWFTDQVRTIARVSTTGHLTRFGIGPEADSVRSMVVGPDGRMWFAAQRTPGVFRMTSKGAVTHLWTPPAAPKAWESLGGMAVASDGAVWVAQPWANKLTRLACRA
jgi:virginiamycin B lyase